MQAPYFDHIYLALRLGFSFFNASLPAYLAFTILNNLPEQIRYRLVNILTAMLLLGASTFFVAHLFVFNGGLPGHFWLRELFWLGGLTSVFLLPLVWLRMVLFYNDPDATRLKLRDRIFFYANICLAGFTAIMVLSTGGVPDVHSVLEGSILFRQAPFAFSIAGYLYSIYILSSTGLALVALYLDKSSPSDLRMAARIKARPDVWRTGLALFSLSLFVSSGLIWFLYRRAWGAHPDYHPELPILLRLDLPALIIVAISLIYLGRAALTYEIFSNNIPRRSVYRPYRLLVVYLGGACMATAVVTSFYPILRLLTPFFIIYNLLFFSLIGRRLARDENRFLGRLRPLLGSQNLFWRVLSYLHKDNSQTTAPQLLQHFCEEIVPCQRAVLVPATDLYPEHDAVIVYPFDWQTPSTIELQHLYQKSQLSLDSGKLNIQYSYLPSSEYGLWICIPLYNAEKLNGLFFLGERPGGQIYTNEDLELARAGAERLLDHQAAIVLASLLLQAQRDQLTESHWIDESTRRQLHDEVLPAIHTLVLKYANVNVDSSQANSQPDLAQNLMEIHQSIASILRSMPRNPGQTDISNDPVGTLRQILATDASYRFDRVVWRIDRQAQHGLLDWPEWKRELLFFCLRELLRNASRYGRRTCDTRQTLHVRLRLAIHPDHLVATLTDNGIGSGSDSISQGSGQGLLFYQRMVAIAGGSLILESRQGHFTLARLQIPRT